MALNTMKFAGVVYEVHTLRDDPKTGIKPPLDDLKLIGAGLRQAQRAMKGS